MKVKVLTFVNITKFRDVKIGSDKHLRSSICGLKAIVTHGGAGHYHSIDLVATLFLLFLLGGYDGLKEYLLLIA